jgi:hypothetical protein
MYIVTKCSFLYQAVAVLNKIHSVYTVMVFNTTFNNIYVISWQSVLLVEETEVPGENILHYVVTSTPRQERDSNSQR